MQKYAILITILITILSISFLSRVEAAPNAMGQTGNLVTPSADFMRGGQAAISWHQQDGIVRNSLLLPLNNRFEVSIQQGRIAAGGAEVQVQAKYLRQAEGIFRPGIAIGVEDVFADKRRSCYTAMSKTFPYGIRLHAGIGTGRLQGVFSALEYQVRARKPASFFREAAFYLEQSHGQTAYGVRLSFPQGWKLEFGRQGCESFTGVSYRFAGL